MALPINFNPYAPVPNTPFFSPRTNSISTPQGAGLIVGSGLDVSQGGTLSAIGTVDVTRVDTGVGLTGGPITSTGTISLANTAVTAGSYTYGSFTVDAQGRLTAAASGTNPVTAVTGTAPISVTAGTTPVVSIAAASTTASGAVQLNNTTSSTSTTLALTAAQGKNLQDQIDALALTSNITLGGTFNASTGLVDSVTTQGTTAGLAVGSPLPAAASSNAEIFVIVDVQGSTGPSGTPPYHIGDWFLSNGTAWQFLNVGFQAPAATTTVEGTVYLATNLEVQTGTDTSNKAVNPASLQAKVSDSTSTTNSYSIASSTAVKSAYDLANAALPKAGGTMTGAITFNAGQTFPVAGIADATTSSKGLVQIGTNVNVSSGTISVCTAEATTLGLLYGCTNGSTAGPQQYNVALGYGANNTITTGCYNVAIGGASGDVTTGSNNVAIGFDKNVADPTANRQLAIGPDAYGSWLTGDTLLNIKPGAGVFDSTNSLGTAGQILSSTGTALQWADPSPAGVEGVTGTAPITVDNTDAANPIIGIDAASTTAAGAVQLNDTTSSTSTTEAATANAVKSAYDLANSALPKAGGTMTGSIVFNDAEVYTNLGVCFQDFSKIQAISDSTSTTSSTTAASSTAVKSAYDLANSALPKAGGTMTGDITFTVGQTFPITGIQDATTGQKGVVQVGTNIQVASGVISVLSSSTTQSGIVQLNDTLASTSVTEALTANQGKALQTQIDALTTASNLTLAGTFDASASQILTVTSAGTAQSFVVGNNLPAAAAGNTDYFVIVTTGGSYNPPGGGGPYTVSQGDWLLSTGTAWQFLNVGTDLPVATTGTAGIVQLATTLETQTGTNTTKAITPSAAAGTYIPLTTLTAKGSLISASAANTPSALAVGTNGQVLTADSACANGLKWSATAIPTAATPTAAGTVLGCTNATNAFLGCNAGKNITSGTGNVAIGLNAGYVIQTGVNNVYIGNTAGISSTSSGNVAIGGSASICNTSGGRNTAVGEQAAQANCTGEYNAAFGWAALQNATVGCNTALGGAAGQSITTGGYNVAIGANVQVASGTASCQLAIGWEGCRWITGDSNKNLCVYNGLVFKTPAAGPPSPSVATADTYFLMDSTYGATLSMANVFGNGKQYIQFRNPSNAYIGNIQQTSNTTIAYTTSSDYRLKENVKDIEGATEVLRALPVREFNFISEPEVVHQGFLAHELQEFVPLAVTGTKDEVDAEGNAKYQGVDASKVVPLLVAALKESIARIDALEAEVKKLKSNT